MLCRCSMRRRSLWVLFFLVVRRSRCWRRCVWLVDVSRCVVLAVCGLLILSVC